jgi:HD-like signal output (HDOD) protein
MGTKKDFSTAVEEVTELLPNMTLLSRLSVALKDLNTGMDDLGALVRTDAALSAEVIRISNTPLYRTGDASCDVVTSLTKIGFGEVLRIVSTILAKDACSRDLEKYGITADEFWEESLTVSLLMDALAKRCGLNNADAATLGILYGLGRIVINNILEDFDIPILWDPAIEVAEWERAVVGFDYAQAGSRVMKKWEFPIEIIYDIAYHLDPGKAPKARPMLCLLNYVVRLLPLVGVGCFEQSYELPKADTYTKLIKMDDQAVREAVKEASSAFIRFQQSVFAA